MNRNIRLLTWFNFFTDFKLYAPVAILYFSHVSGSFALGMSIFSVSMISAAFFEIPTGILSDRIGRKYTILLGSLAAVMYTVFYAAAGTYIMLFTGAVLEGLSKSFYSGNNDALLHDSLKNLNTQHLYADYLGKISAMFQAALAMSSLLGGVLAYWSYPVIMWVSVLPQFICLILTVFLEDPGTHETGSTNIYTHLKDAVQIFFTNRKLRLLSLVSIFTEGMGEAGYQFQSAFYNSLIPVWAIGAVKALSNIGGSISFYYSTRILKKFGIRKVLLFQLFYNRAVNSIASLFPTILSPILVSSSSFLYGASNTALNSLMQNEFTDTKRATMSSLNSFAGSLCFAGMAYLLGLAADITGVTTAFLLFQFLQLLNYFLYRKLFSALSV